MATNPVLNDDRFDKIIEANFGTGQRERTMTIGGTMSALGVLLTLLVAAAVFGWMQVEQTSVPVLNALGQQVGTQNTTSFPWWTFLALLAAFGLVMASIFVPKIAFITGPLYAIAEGLVLGVISAFYNQQWDGIVVQAVLATMSVVFVTFLLYVTRIVKVTSKFVLITLAATLGIGVMYLVSWIISLFSSSALNFWNQPSALSIGISVVIIIVGAMNLLVDFAFIETATKAGDVPRRMEWTAAVGVTVTIVWLYMEILRLISLLRR